MFWKNPGQNTVSTPGSRHMRTSWTVVLMQKSRINAWEHYGLEPRNFPTSFHRLIYSSPFFKAPGSSIAEIPLVARHLLTLVLLLQLIPVSHSPLPFTVPPLPLWPALTHSASLTQDFFFSGVPVVVQWERVPLGTMRMWVSSLTRSVG